MEYINLGNSNHCFVIDCKHVCVSKLDNSALEEEVFSWYFSDGLIFQPQKLLLGREQNKAKRTVTIGPESRKLFQLNVNGVLFLLHYTSIAIFG